MTLHWFQFLFCFFFNWALRYVLLSLGGFYFLHGTSHCGDRFFNEWHDEWFVIEWCRWFQSLNLVFSGYSQSYSDDQQIFLLLYSKYLNIYVYLMSFINYNARHNIVNVDIVSYFKINTNVKTILLQCHTISIICYCIKEYCKKMD